MSGVLNQMPRLFFEDKDGPIPIFPFQQYDKVRTLCSAGAYQPNNIIHKFA